KWLLSFVHHLAIDTNSPITMKKVIELLVAGGQVAIFPEGRITVTGSRMKIYDGPAFVAAKSGAQIVPVHIEGPLFSYFSRVGKPFPKKLFPRITISIDQTFTITMPEAR